MDALKRRQALSGLAACTASAVLLPALSATPLQPRAIPQTPMQLTRRIVRALRDGQSIQVEREWTIEFASTSAGIEITGEQTAVQVAAPQELAALAAMEQGRREESFLPLILDERGLIRSNSAAAPYESEALDQAVVHIENLLSTSQLSSERKGAAREYIALIQKAAQPLISTMPTDLFYPAEQEQKGSRSIQLPDGQSGEFEWSYLTSVDPQTGWLKSAERIFTTRIGEASRTSEEYWSMARLQQGPRARGKF